MDAGRRPRHERAPGRDADRTLGVGVGEAHAVGRQLIQRGRLDGGMTGGAEQRGGPVVRTDQ